jgi:broad specificity phosphatase PhoE
MSALYLVRHAQASFGADDYDRLSDLGLEQARLTGAALRERIPGLHAVFTGTQRRHRETADACLAAFGASPPRRALPGLDEYDHEEILARAEPRHADRGALAADLAAAGDPRRAFQEIFARAVHRWTGGAHDAEYAERWPDFRRRCVAALEEVAASVARPETALVFTSGGPISAMCAALLRVPDAEALRASWALVNAGVTKVLGTRGGLVLSTLNEHGHLERAGRSLVTHR